MRLSLLFPQAAFEALGIVAVITNCALIGMAAKSAHWLPEMTTVNAILMFVAIEVSRRFVYLRTDPVSSQKQQQQQSPLIF